MVSDVLQLSSRITLLPIVHGSGDFSVEVRRILLAHKWDCLAVPLPESFQEPVERAIEFLPNVTAVVQREPKQFSLSDNDDELHGSYVPIDPCQPVIAALRFALQERLPRAFIDQETNRYEPVTHTIPDPYALKKVKIEQFAAAVLPAIPRLPAGQPVERVRTMADRLRELEEKHENILCLCSMWDWPWIKEAYNEQSPAPGQDEDVNFTDEPEIYGVAANTLVFLTGEFPFITGLYEQARAELDDDENLSVDGLKALLLTTRDRYKVEMKSRGRQLTPALFSNYFKYVRNLSLIDRRMTPDHVTMIVAAQQIAGDQFALVLNETLCDYQHTARIPFPTIEMGIDQARLPDGDIIQLKSRLPLQPSEWSNCQLQPRPVEIDQEKWQASWNPHSQCSWPPEDQAIESFRTRVKDIAQQLLGNDLARSEKFTTSLRDGLDIRETLRNWHTGELYVKVVPPTRGKLDCVLMFFDSPSDPRDYPWRITWYAEHQDESTLSLFATDFRQEMVGPGVCVSTYGGAMFLFPPRPIIDVWRDPRFDFADTLETRLLAAACHHAEARHIAILADAPPGLAWRRLAKKYGKQLIHIPTSRFGSELMNKLRTFHVLNGQIVRSYAAHFIRKP